MLNMENHFAFAYHGERVLALLRVASHVTSVKRLYNASLSPTYLPTVSCSTQHLFLSTHHYTLPTPLG